MTHEITCRGCGSLLTFTGDNPGKYIRCPECGHLTIMTLEDNPGAPHRAFAGSVQGGGLDALIAGLAGIIVSFSCGCLAPSMLIANLLGLYIGFRSAGPLKWYAITTNLIAIMLETALGWWYWW